MKLYEIYYNCVNIPQKSGYGWIVANNKIEAMDIFHLIISNEEVYSTIEKITAINPFEGGYIKCKKLIKDWKSGYFDSQQGMIFEHRKNKHWYPFVEFSVRAHYADIALKDITDLEMSE